MKTYEQLTKEEKKSAVSKVVEIMVEDIVDGALDFETGKPEDEEFIAKARETAFDTGDYAAICTQVCARFNNDLKKLATVVAEDSFYTDEGELIEQMVN